MALGFTHVLGGWIAGKFTEKFSVQFRQPEWALLLLGSILPDIDLIIQWSTGMFVHRLFTHSLAFLMLSGIIVYIVSSVIKNRNLRPQVGALAMMLGVTMHLLIDMVGVAGIQLLWPYPVFISFSGVSALVPQVWAINQALINLFIVDGMLGLGWIAYLMLIMRLRP